MSLVRMWSMWLATGLKTYMDNMTTFIDEINKFLTLPKI